MSSESKDSLIAQFAEDRQELARLVMSDRLRPLLGLELTLRQLKAVLLVTAGTAVTGSQLASALHVSPPTISASVDKLVDLGYLVRSEAGSDRRVKRLVPTAKAQQLYDRLFARHEESDELVATLALEDLAALVRGTSALRRALERRTDGER
ncbi:MarR family winged helix-turn-helix transcriptional regulator [Microbacterium album]|uniref:HTH marR-type domain-containing protein n=1 Tax=Microbacterium album TaxID=2053191 RepID=A0A917IF05_9MICO|nr:MarR family transcriptional regulator [Microbacterium album]GGH41965.1 hypothetical protein GCM10010921_14880 [Microbacterium album]